MRKNIFITTLTFTLLLLTFSFVVAQPTIQWEKSLGGSSNETARHTIQTIDGGYIVVGQSNSNDGDVTGNNGSNDYWLVKLDVNGSIQWQSNYGGSGDDVPAKVVQTFDKGYFIVGRTGSNDGDVGINLGGTDIWVLKVDSLGSLLWKKSLGGSATEIAYDTKQTADSGFVVVGHSKSIDGDLNGNSGFEDYWVVKLDGFGNIQWQKSLGGTQPDKAYSIQQTYDLGYIVVGESFSADGDVTSNNGGRDYWIVKLDDIGNVQWQKNYGGSSHETAWSIEQTQDSGYVVAGSSASNDGDVTGHKGGIGVDDYWIIKLDNLGNLLWQKSLGGTSIDKAIGVKQFSDGGYAIVGTTASSDGDVSATYGNGDYWLVKLDSLGNLLWEKNYGGTFSETTYSFLLTNDNGFIICGGSTSIDGDVTGNHGLGDFWVVKLGAITGINEKEKNMMLIYPNPSNNGKYTIEGNLQYESIEVYDLLGKRVISKTMRNRTTIIDLRGYKKGTYLIKILAKNKVMIKKIIYQ